MTTTQNEVRFNAGETLVLSDFHDMQRFVKSGILDQFLGSSIRSTFVDPGFPTSTVAALALCRNPGGGYPKPDAGTRQVTNTAGLVSQWISSGTPAGLTNELLSYQLAANELQFTLGANASGNPRIDAVCIKLSSDDSQDQQTRDFEDATTHALSSQSMYKKRRTVLASQVVVGTPAANPAAPAPPAGYAVFALVWVPNGYAAAFDHNHVWDARLPMHVGTSKVTAIQAIKNNFTLDADWYSLSDAGGAGTYGCYFPFPRGADCRILAINPMANVLGGNIGIRKLFMTSPSLPATTPLALGVFDVSITTGGGFPASMLVPYGSTAVTPPIWGNGFACGAYAASNIGATGANATALIASIPGTGSNSSRIGAFEWVYAY